MVGVDLPFPDRKAYCHTTQSREQRPRRNTRKRLRWHRALRLLESIRLPHQRNTTTMLGTSPAQKCRTQKQRCWKTFPRQTHHTLRRNKRIQQRRKNTTRTINKIRKDDHTTPKNNQVLYTIRQLHSSHQIHQLPHRKLVHLHQTRKRKTHKQPRRTSNTRNSHRQKNHRNIPKHTRSKNLRNTRITHRHLAKPAKRHPTRTP